MPRNRPRYHHLHTRLPTPPPTPTRTPTRRHLRLNQKLISGVLLVLLSLLVLLIIFKALPYLTPWPAYQPLPSAATWFEGSAPHSIPRAPHRAIRTTLKTISALVTELNRTLTTSCPGCVWRTGTGQVCIRTFYNNGDIAMITSGVLFAAVCWVLGMVLFLDGVADIAPPFKVRVQNWGLGGGIVAAAVVAFMGLGAQWYWWLLFALVAAFGGMMIGLFVTPEEQVVKWKRDVKAES
ncbi:hypothetical protein V493_03685 [Pseudogymnoascus sp. VKM F-4281 (FW-2241)]|nr:hypothetical protein V493_03685 [Pseudogymnoascus sp. VKM F-4281 (FW-2241)]